MVVAQLVEGLSNAREAVSLPPSTQSGGSGAHLKLQHPEARGKRVRAESNLQRLYGELEVSPDYVSYYLKTTTKQPT